MGDLVKRLRDINANYELARGIHCDISEAADRIEALEARIARADALAEVVGAPIQSDSFVGQCCYDWHRIDEALAAYRADQ